MGEYTSKGQGNLNTVLGALGTASFAGLDLNTIIDKLGGKNNIDPIVYMTMMNANKGNSGPADLAAIIAALAPLVTMFVSSSAAAKESSNDSVSNETFNMAQKLNAAEAALAAEKSERYTDKQLLGSVKEIFNEFRNEDNKIASVVKDVTAGFIEMNKEMATIKTEVACIAKEVQRNREEARSYTDSEVRHEAQMRKSADDNLASWTQGEFYKYQGVLNTKITGELNINGSQINYHGYRPVLQPNCDWENSGSGNRNRNGN